MQAQAGRMGHQLYSIVYKEERIKGYYKDGKPKIEKVRGFRVPRSDDNVMEIVQKRLEESFRSGKRVTLFRRSQSMREIRRTSRCSTERRNGLTFSIRANFTATA